MRLVQASQDAFVFELSAREKEMLGAVLRRYPLLNPDYHQFTRGRADAKVAESQKLFHEALAQQHAANKQQVAEFMSDDNWPRSHGGRFLLTLDNEKMEWLLQVLNDVRVGSWVKLGRPDTQRGDQIDPTPENLPYIAAMELGGLFQSLLLGAMES